MPDEYGNIVDEEEVITPEEDDDEELDFSKIFGSLDDDDEEEVEEEEEETVEEEDSTSPVYNSETGDWEDPKTGEKLLSQSKVNEIVGSSRIKGREYEDNVKYLESMTGMPFAEVVKQVRDSQVQKAVDEYNMPPEEAQRYVDAIPTNRIMQQEILEIKSRQQMQDKYMQVQAEKQQHMNNPLAQKYEKEIDDIVMNMAQKGQFIDWGIAMNQVLGEKAYQGDLRDVFEKTAEKRVAKARHPKIAPEIGGGAVASEIVPKELAFFAKALGEDPREVHQEYKKMSKKR